MDYKKLLELADQKQDALNSFRSKRGGQGFSGRGPDPSAIASFKAKKEREERERAVRAQREKDYLLSLRAQNSKSLKKSKMMQLRTKDNDFSKINITDGEAKDQEKVDAKIKKRGITGTKERMKAKIEMDQKLHGLTRRDREKLISRMEKEEPVKVAKQKPTISEIISKAKSTSKTKTPTSGPSVPKAPRAAAPPALSYNDLLSLASEKAKTKVTLEDHIKSEMTAAEKRQRPMTAREKERYREEQYYRNRSGDARLPSAEEIARNSQINKRPIAREEPEDEEEPYEPEPYEPMKMPPKGNNRLNGSSSNQSQAYTPAATNHRTPISNSRPPISNGRQPPPSSASNSQSHSSVRNSSSSSVNQSQRASVPNGHNRSANPNGSLSTNQSRVNGNSNYSNSQSQRANGSASSQLRSSMESRDRPPPANHSRVTDRDRMPPPKMAANQRSVSQQPSRGQLPPSRGNGVGAIGPPPPSRGAPPPRPRAYSPSPPPQSYRPRVKLPPIGATYRRGMYNDYEPLMDEEEEEDYYEDEEDDMADFIDDGPDEAEAEPEYTRAIREIFGYDKRKYRNIDDDDDIEEASFADCMKEEKASLRAGIQEDLEDMRMEEEEKRAKALARKRAKHR